MVYSLGIPKQTATAKAKHGILACLKENVYTGYTFSFLIMFHIWSFEKNIWTILLEVGVYYFLTNTNPVTAYISFMLN